MPLIPGLFAECMPITNHNHDMTAYSSKHKAQQLAQRDHCKVWTSALTFCRSDCFQWFHGSGFVFLFQLPKEIKTFVKWKTNRNQITQESSLGTNNALNHYLRNEASTKTVMYVSNNRYILLKHVTHNNYQELPYI